MNNTNRTIASAVTQDCPRRGAGHRKATMGRNPPVAPFPGNQTDIGLRFEWEQGPKTFRLVFTWNSSHLPRPLVFQGYSRRSTRSQHRWED
jgi:hypothetical protein